MEQAMDLLHSNYLVYQLEQVHSIPILSAILTKLYHVLRLHLI